jgi:hypothetical protein
VCSASFVPSSHGLLRDYIGVTTGLPHQIAADLLHHPTGQDRARSRHQWVRPPAPLRLSPDRAQERTTERIGTRRLRLEQRAEHLGPPFLKVDVTLQSALQ